MPDGRCLVRAVPVALVSFQMPVVKKEIKKIKEIKENKEKPAQHGRT